MQTCSSALTAYILCIAALFGAAMGSFVNCASARLGSGESVLKGRSHCPACGHVLGAIDLIPVAGYLLLRGRCRYCGARIAPRCLVTELLGAAACVSLVLCYGVTLQAAAYAAMLFMLLAAALVDLDTGLIPDRLILMGIGAFLVYALFQKPVLPALLRGLLGGFAASVPLLLFVLLADRLMGRETMGGGDIKLFFMAGLYFDWQRAILLLIFSCLCGIAFAVYAKKKRGAEFPFGPGIAAGAFTTALFGAPLLNWYLGLFF